MPEPVQSTPLFSGMAIRYRKLLAHYYNLMIPPDSSVLEIGFGSGELLRNLNCQQRCGIDTSETLVQQAHDNVPLAKFWVVDGISFKPDQLFD